MSELTKTTLHRYNFNIATAEGKAGYNKLSEKLKALGLKCFESLGGKSHFLTSFDDVMTAHVELETKHLFNDQWNTAPIEGISDKGLRLFDWAQDAQHQNFCPANIRRGHWLEQTVEMKSLRDNTMACGYCGKQEPAAKGYVFCPHCIDSEYLEKKDLCLLRMRNVSALGERGALTESEAAYLIPLYVAAQSGATSARAKARHDKKRADLKVSYDKTVRVAETEFKGFTWLMDHGLNVYNCIYYGHTDRFSFGWRNPMDADVVNDVLEVISEFPFQYEIKCADGRKLSN